MTTQTTQKASLFAKAKQVDKTAKKKDEHPIITLAENNYEGISEKLIQLQNLRNSIADMEGELKMLEGEVKQIAKTEYLNLYQQRKCNPNSFKMKGEKGGCVMIIPMDRYKMLDEATFAHIAETFGEEIVEQKTTYSFNTEVLQRNEAIISDLIMNCPKISQSDKENLLEQKTTYNIRKGTIDRLFEFFGSKLRDVFFAIEPVFQIKNCK